MNKPNIKIIIAKTQGDFLKGRELILEYVDWLGLDLSFQNFDDEIHNLPEMYSVPNGCLILAVASDKTVGVAGIRKYEMKICELKRMYVKEAYRNLGIGRLILECAIKCSKKLDYKFIRLDTDDSMKAAIKLYLDYGFKEIGPYRFNPNKSVKYFELKL